MKSFTNTHLAILTSMFIIVSVSYSLMIDEPIYKLTSYLHNAIIIVSITTLAIHFNALKENEEKKKLILVSLLIPVATIIYFTIGLIYWINLGK